MGLAARMRELGLLIVDHKRFAAQRTIRGRRAFSALFKAVHWPTYRKRRRLCAMIGPVGEGFAIPEDEGFVLWRPASFPPLAEAMAEANALFAAADLESLKDAMPPHGSFTHVPFDLRPESAVGRLATHPVLIKAFAEYMGVVPVLHVVQLMYSPNHRLVPGSAQYYHLDGQDVRSLQVFVYLHDVTPENGPLTLVPAAASDRIAAGLRYRKAGAGRRIDDEVVGRFVDLRREVRVLTGRSGSVLVFDGDRCFHFGSRQATKPRRILHYAYLSPFAFTLPPRWWTSYRHLVSEDAPEWQRSVVTRT